VIIDHGRVVRQGAVADLYGAERAVVVRCEDRDAVERLAGANGWTFHLDGPDRLVIRGTTTAAVGRAAAAAGIALAELSVQTSTRRLEDLFLDLTTAEAIA
jgi:ABC-2 type transport system ATP-binding protein